MPLRRRVVCQPAHQADRDRGGLARGGARGRLGAVRGRRRPLPAGDAGRQQLPRARHRDRPPLAALERPRRGARPAQRHRRAAVRRGRHPRRAQPLLLASRTASPPTTWPPRRSTRRTRPSRSAQARSGAAPAAGDRRPAPGGHGAGDLDGALRAGPAERLRGAAPLLPAAQRQAALRRRAAGRDPGPARDPRTAGPGRASHTTCGRRSSRALRSTRETCIWLIPTSRGDLRLGEPAVVPQHHDPPVARAQPAQRRHHHGAASAATASRSSATSTSPTRRPLAVAGADVERRRGEAAVGAERLEHLVHVDAELVRPPRPGAAYGPAPGSARHADGDPLLELLDAARRSHRPGVVAEVPPDLTADDRHRVLTEVVPAGRVEAAHGLHQTRRSRPARGRPAARRGRGSGRDAGRRGG